MKQKMYHFDGKSLKANATESQAKNVEKFSTTMCCTTMRGASAKRSMLSRTFW